MTADNPFVGSDYFGDTAHGLMEASNLAGWGDIADLGMEMYWQMLAACGYDVPPPEHREVDGLIVSSVLIAVAAQASKAVTSRMADLAQVDADALDDLFADWDENADRIGVREWCRQVGDVISGADDAQMKLFSEEDAPKPAHYEVRYVA